MATYDCIQDYGQQPGAPFISQSANWIIAVFRFLYPNTFSRSNFQSFLTINGGIAKATAQRQGGPLVISSGVLNMDISSMKAGHTMSLAAMLAPDLQYEAEIYPGDWVMAWTFTNDTDYERILGRLRAYTSKGGNAVNGFNDGLKFVGRLQSIRKNLTQAPDGRRNVRYSMMSVGFSELDSYIFFNPASAEDAKTSLGLLWGRLNVELQNFIAEPDYAGGGAQGFAPSKALPFFIELFLGTGVDAYLNRNDSDKETTQGVYGGTSTGDSPNAQYAYRVPSQVAQALGKAFQITGAGVGYADLLETCVGIQQYNAGSGTSQNSGPQPVPVGSQSGQNFGQAFQPLNLDSTASTGNRRVTKTPLNGVILPQTPNFSGQGMWTILSQFLNPGMNEQYICLRANPQGSVVPTYVARQFPFSTALYNGYVLTRPNVSETVSDPGQQAAASALVYGPPPGGPLPHTKFLSLPTWGIDPVMVVRAEIGRSDALRFNFVYVYGNSEKGSETDQGQAAYSPPLHDDLDIARSGLRPYMTTVPCQYNAVALGDAAKWMSLLADFHMGQQLTLTGSLTCAGIQAPICIGDNLEWEGNTYHIEGITHHVEIGASGHKNFSTTLSLTFGVSSKPVVYSDQPDLGLYGDIDPVAKRPYDPGFTVDEPNTVPIDDSLQQGDVTGPTGDNEQVAV